MVQAHPNGFGSGWRNCLRAYYGLALIQRQGASGRVGHNEKGREWRKANEDNTTQ